MKVYATISVHKHQVTPEILDYCYQLNPAGMMPGGWTGRFPLEDAETQRLLEMLDALGLSPHDPRFKKKEKGEGFRRRKENEYSLHLERVYSHEDLKGLPYLQPLPEDYTGYHGGFRNLEGKIVVDERPGDFGVAFIRTWYVISQRLRRLIEEHQLIGAEFGSVEIAKKLAARGATKQDWWELSSSVTLPPLSTSMKLLNSRGDPYEEDPSKGAMRQKDGRFIHTELRYRAADLENVRVFDFAHTQEMFGRGPDKHDRLLVVSNRFYHLCVENGVQTNWAPVHVEHD